MTQINCRTCPCVRNSSGIVSTMTCVLIIVTQNSNDSDGNSANKLVTLVQPMKLRSVMLSAFTGNALRCLVNTAPISVVAAITAAKPKSYAKPQVSLWGFITLNQTYISTP